MARALLAAVLLGKGDGRAAVSDNPGPGRPAGGHGARRPLAPRYGCSPYGCPPSSGVEARGARRAETVRGAWGGPAAAAAAAGRFPNSALPRVGDCDSLGGL